MRVHDLGLIPYRHAWQLQESLHAQVLAGGEEHLLLLEHPPVITLGRRAADSQKNLLAPPDVLATLGVDVVESDRGGDITFHGPGQLVAYPIVKLNDHGLSVGGYVRRLEDAVIATLAEFDVEAFKDDSAIGVWVRQAGSGFRVPGSGNTEKKTVSGTISAAAPSSILHPPSSPPPPSSPNPEPSTLNPPSAKICALGVRIKRGVSLHGIALNLDTDLAFFNLINPCGLGRPVISLTQLLADRAPTMSRLKRAFARQFASLFA